MPGAKPAPAPQNSGVPATTSNRFLATEQRDMAPPRTPSDPQLPWQGHLTACLVTPASKIVHPTQNRPLLSKNAPHPIGSDPHPSARLGKQARGANPPSGPARALLRLQSAGLFIP